MPEGIQREAELLRSDGELVRYCELGRGRPLVIATAFGIPFAYWQPLVQQLASGFRVLFPKQRGVWGGARPADAEHVRVSDHASDLAAVIQRLELRDVVLLGHCSGVAPLLDCLPCIASQASHLVCVSARYQPGIPIEVERLLARAAQNAAMYQRIVAVAGAYAPAALREALRRELREPASLAAQLRALASARSFRCAPPPAQLATDVLYAEADAPDLRESARAFVDSAPSPRLRAWDISAAGHFFLQEQPERAATLLRELVRGSSTGAQ